MHYSPQITTVLTKVGSETTLEGDLLTTRLLLANSAFDPLIFMVTSDAFCSRLRKVVRRALRQVSRGGRADGALQLNAPFARSDSDANTGLGIGNGKSIISSFGNGRLQLLKFPDIMRHIP